MDKSYGLIRIYNKKIIEFYYLRCTIFYNCNCKVYSYPICFTSSSINLMFSILSLHSHFNLLSTQHKLYLGKELCKAEISTKINQYYIQE